MEEVIPALQHLQEFEEILANYHVSEGSKGILKQTNLALLIAPTATGRNTIIDELVETGNYYFIVSDTTRPPQLRDGRMEQNGREYFFRQEEEVLEDLRKGAYLEAELIHRQQVSGISIREIEKAAATEKIAITDIDILGVHNIKVAKPDTAAIFVLPPSFDEWQRRLMHRGFMGPEERRRRLETAHKMFELALDSSLFSFVVNDTVDEAAIRINQIARFNIVDKSYQEQCRELVKQLLVDTADHLKQPA